MAVKALKAKKPAGISCLVTGFVPFYGQPFNPSEVIAQSMPAELTLPKSKLKIPVKGLVLPVTSKECWQVLKPVVDKMIKNKQACVLIMLGVAGSRNNINLERYALNLRDDSRPDNKGRIIRNEKLVELAPEAFRTNAPIEKALDHLKEKGWPAEISNYVGTYICGEIYFRTMHYFDSNFKNSRLPYSVVFVHVPPPKSYGTTLKKNGSKKTLQFATGKNKQMKAMLEAVKAIVEFNSETLVNDILHTKH